MKYSITTRKENETQIQTLLTKFVKSIFLETDKFKPNEGHNLKSGWKPAKNSSKFKMKSCVNSSSILAYKSMSEKSGYLVLWKRKVMDLKWALEAYSYCLAKPFFVPRSCLKQSHPNHLFKKASSFIVNLENCADSRSDFVEGTEFSTYFCICVQSNGMKRNWDLQTACFWVLLLQLLSFSSYIHEFIWRWKRSSILAIFGAINAASYTESDFAKRKWITWPD